MEKLNNIKPGTWVYFENSQVIKNSSNWIVLFDSIKKHDHYEKPVLWSWLAVSRSPDKMGANFINMDYGFNNSVHNPRPASSDEIIWALHAIQIWYFSKEPFKILTHILCSQSQILKNNK